MRRDVRKLVAAIRTSAWLHQFNRERDTKARIIATEADFEMARQLLKPSLRQAHVEMTPSEERVWAAIMELDAEQRRDGFKRRDIGDIPTVAARTVKLCLRSLCESGYLESDGRKGQMGSTYTVVRENIISEFEISLARSTYLPIIPLTDTEMPKNCRENDDFSMGNLMGSEMGKTGNNRAAAEVDDEIVHEEREAIRLEGCGRL
jgi:hypothetical protein